MVIIVFKKKSDSYVLTPWDIALLLGICAAPIFGSGAAISVMIVSLISIVMMIYEKNINPERANWIIFIIFMGYFLFFIMQSALIGGNLLNAFLSMKGNLPIFFAAIFCLYIGRRKNNLTTSQIGYWATIATFATLFFALFLHFLGASHIFATEFKILSDFEHGGRLRLFSRNALMFGSMYTTLCFLSLLGYSGKSKLQKISAWLALICGLGVVALWAQSRGALLAAIPVMGIALWYTKPKFLKIISSIFFVAVIFIATYFLSDIFAQKIDVVWEGIYSGMLTVQGASKLPDNSILQRKMMYQFGLSAIYDAPFFGHGYASRFEAIIPYFESGITFRHGHLHNTFISHAVAGGLFGLVVLLFFILTPLIIEAALSPKSNDIRYFSLVIVLMMVGIGMTTEILGHRIHSSFFSTLILMHLVVVMNEKIFESRKL